MGAARTNVESAIGELGDYTALERQAMVTIEALKLVNGLDLAAVLERGRLLREIEAGGLVGVHPGGYRTLEEMARDQGISISELSDTRTLCDVIFPWIEEHLDTPVAQVWDQIGKSGFRELVPVLRSLITGDETGSTSTRQAVERVLSDTTASATANGEELTPEETTERAIRHVVEVGISNPVREIRRQLRPDHTRDIATLFIQNEQSTYAVMRLNEDQMTMFMRLAGTHLNASRVTAEGREQYVEMLGSIFGADE
jgi:hypothetical protein